MSKSSSEPNSQAKKTANEKISADYQPELAKEVSPGLVESAALNKPDKSTDMGVESITPDPDSTEIVLEEKTDTDQVEVQDTEQLSDQLSNQTVDREEHCAKTQTLAGYTSVSSRALSSAIKAACAQTLNVAPRKVNVEISDHEAQLGARISTPVTTSTVLDTARNETDLFAELDEVRLLIADKASAVTGHQLGKIDFLINGITASWERQENE